jgi:hypothetical protein
VTTLRRLGVIAAQVWDRSLGRLLSALLVGMIRAYQVTISPLTGPTCRYHPTCSAYALRAVREHGPLKGAALAGWRLLRCNPWSPGGIDYPPRRGEWHGIHEVQVHESGGMAETGGTVDVVQM